MSAQVQTIMVGVLIAAALAFLAWHFIKRRHEQHKCENCDIAKLVEKRRQIAKSRRFPLH